MWTGGGVGDKKRFSCGRHKWMTHRFLEQYPVSTLGPGQEFLLNASWKRKEVQFINHKVLLLYLNLSEVGKACMTGVNL